MGPVFVEEQLRGFSAFIARDVCVQGANVDGDEVAVGWDSNIRLKNEHFRLQNLCFRLKNECFRIQIKE